MFEDIVDKKPDFMSKIGKVKLSNGATMSLDDLILVIDKSEDKNIIVGGRYEKKSI